MADEVNSPARMDSRPVSKKTGLDVLCPEPVPGSNINNGYQAVEGNDFDELLR